MNRSVQMPVSSHQYESSQSGGYVNDGGLLDPTCPATEDGHLLTHNDGTIQLVVGGEGKGINVNLELIKLAYLVAITCPHAARKISSYNASRR